MKKISIILLVMVLAYPAYVMSSIYWYSLHSSLQPAQAALVLGAAVWDGRPSPVFEQRIKHAIKLYHAKQVEKLVFTGGVGEGDSLSEAAVAMEYAIKHGVASDAILVEETSRFTSENLRFAADLMAENQIQFVLLVSDPLHMKRAMMIADDVGVKAAPSPTQTSRYKSLRVKLSLLCSEAYYYMGYQLSKWL
ncbi:YdcF family protein [Motilimonas eburnea]|uniref:YdcF family protein n=1 Tax=Motilimonas eburnea TaxID=1737488 RepID=UPI001E3E010F|nr:YdcF family protein [Motilimonas eburnea]